MLEVENNTIYLTRGDDAVVGVEIMAGDSVYEMADGDSIVFTVREQPNFESAVLVQIAGAGQRIVIRHEDTAGLEVGRYSADIQLGTAEGRRITVWPQLEGSARYRTRNFRNFVIMPEVTER